MTARAVHVRTVEEAIANKGAGIKILQTARLVNAAADKVREKYIKFIAKLPDQVRSRGKDLKEYFAVDRHATLWWFSLIAEKNTLKTDSFHTLAQLDSIIETIAEEGIDSIVFGCSSVKLLKALKAYGKKKALPVTFLTVRDKEGIGRRIVNLQRLFYVKHLMLMFYFVAHSLLKRMRIKKKCGDINRLKADRNALLIVSYYPHLDIRKAREGVFRNKYFNHLQEAIESEERKIIWVLLYVRNNSISFQESVNHAARFVREGYDIFFLEEFYSIFTQLKNLARMFFSGLKFITAQKRIAALHTFGDYNFYELFRDDWYSSFAGSTGYSGLIYYDSWASVLRRTNTQQCLYCCELHAWEKALICARNKIGGRTLLLGYQHTCISKMELFYFNDKEEILNSGPYRLPKPDEIICNGNRPYTYLVECGWENERLHIAEAIRFNHLKENLKVRMDKKGNVVVVGLSINPHGSSVLLSMANDAFRDLDNVEVWVKPHPFLRFEKALALSGIPHESMPFMVKHEPIEQLLQMAKILVVAESSISVEALAAGCNVINVNSAEFINISPLRGVETEIVSTVSSSEELREAVVRVLDDPHNNGHLEEAKRIVNDFFLLNPNTDVPEKFISLLHSQAVA